MFYYKVTYVYVCSDHYIVSSLRLWDHCTEVLPVHSILFQVWSFLEVRQYRCLRTALTECLEKCLRTALNVCLEECVPNQN